MDTTPRTTRRRATWLAAVVASVGVAAPVLFTRSRSRRRTLSLMARGAGLTQKARRLGRAFERIAHDPDRVAPKVTVASLGSRTVVAMAAMMAQVLATSILRAVVTQRAR